MYLSSEYADWSLVSADGTIPTQPSCHRTSPDVGTAGRVNTLSQLPDPGAAPLYECVRVRLLDACGSGFVAWEGCAVRVDLLNEDESVALEVASLMLTLSSLDPLGQQQYEYPVCPQGPGNYSLRTVSTSPDTALSCPPVSEPCIHTCIRTSVYNKYLTGDC